MKEYLIRLVYCEMLGVECGWGYIYPVKFTQSSNIADKRMGQYNTLHDQHMTHKKLLLVIMECVILTHSLVGNIGALSELDRINVAPPTLHPQHLTVHQPYQILLHLTLVLGKYNISTWYIRTNTVTEYSTSYWYSTSVETLVHSVYTLTQSLSI